MQLSYPHAVPHLCHPILFVPRSPLGASYGPDGHQTLPQWPTNDIVQRRLPHP